MAHSQLCRLTLTRCSPHCLLYRPLRLRLNHPPHRLRPPPRNLIHLRYQPRLQPHLPLLPSPPHHPLPPTTPQLCRPSKEENPPLPPRPRPPPPLLHHPLTTKKSPRRHPQQETLRHPLRTPTRTRNPLRRPTQNLLPRYPSSLSAWLPQEVPPPLSLRSSKGGLNLLH